MKLPDIINLFLIMFLVLMVSSDTNDALQRSLNFENAKYQKAFDSSVRDVAFKMSKLEAQQLVGPVKYSAEKQLTINQDSLTYFMDTLSMSFGIFGDIYRRQELLAHIPVMVQVRYDSYSIVTVGSPDGGVLSQDASPLVWPARPYSMQLSDGVANFTMDQVVSVFKPSTGEWYKGSYSDLTNKYGIEFLHPIENQEQFQQARLQSITDSLQKDVEAGINRYNEIVNESGMNIQVNLSPQISNVVDGVGFMAFIQGYPLPGGEKLTSFSFSRAKVGVQNRLAGVLDADGVLRAYSNKCSVPAGSKVQEYLYDRTESVKKGYFLVDCQ